MSYPFLLCRLRLWRRCRIQLEANAAIRFVAIARQLFESVFVRNEVYHFMESSSKICELRQQADQQVAWRIAPTLRPCQLNRCAVARTFPGEIVRHKGVGGALPQRLIKPNGLLLIFTGDEHPLTGPPACFRQIAHQRFNGA
ncbi:Hypothetical Protein PANA_0495 [Pantoea ananatis LMG 20103]|uniref:Uncharacterized protein n=1 Tax=Pantoea ananatis (strain LMG 20103) TaxID=706191 RepID=D4GIR7_PANAM|nr:Hypothetical Protein PANA_0495 [Pantoea ananatis LMG 20103]